MARLAWIWAALLVFMALLQSVVLAMDMDDDLDEFEAFEAYSRRLTESASPSDPSATTNKESDRLLADAGAPVVDPNIPPGLEELELLAFRIEYADDQTLGVLVEWAYEWVVRDRGHDDGLLRARDLPDFLHRTLNPAEEDIEDDERAMLNEASAALREEQGLNDDRMILHVGFLSRGSPLRYMRSLAHRMHHQHRARRLQAKEDNFDEDRDL